MGYRHLRTKFKIARPAGDRTRYQRVLNKPNSMKQKIIKIYNNVWKSPPQMILTTLRLFCIWNDRWIWSRTHSHFARRAFSPDELRFQRSALSAQSCVWTRANAARCERCRRTWFFFFLGLAVCDVAVGENFLMRATHETSVKAVTASVTVESPKGKHVVRELVWSTWMIDRVRDCKKNNNIIIEILEEKTFDRSGSVWGRLCSASVWLMKWKKNKKIDMSENCLSPSKDNIFL